MGELLNMEGRKLKEAGFDLQAVIVVPGDPNAAAALEEVLTQGFEPFAVTPHIVPKQSGIATVGEAQKPIMADKVWLKKRVLVEVIK